MRISNDFLTPAQGKKLKELGDYLREVRMHRGLTVSTVAQRTRIQERLIRAIESADVQELPEPIYIQALIHRMGDAVGVEGKTLAAAFPTQPNLRAIKPSWKPVKKPWMRPFHLYLVYVTVMIGVVSGLSLVVRSPSPQLAQSEPESTVEATEPATTDRPSPTQPVVQEAVQVASPPVEPDKVTVTMKLEEESWVRIVADGSVQFEGTLAKGEERTWQADDELTVRAGNAGAVVVKINNAAEAKPLGNPGAVQTVTYQPPVEQEEKKPS
ncbi:MAG: helix-turn-helix domain-containing protein [Spirulina sp. SIO3F2]|nr:helix-turn-helix domain-containing protein [Spirulina sp. SIO3F2]